MRTLSLSAFFSCHGRYSCIKAVAYAPSRRAVLAAYSLRSPIYPAPFKEDLVFHRLTVEPRGANGPPAILVAPKTQPFGELTSRADGRLPNAMAARAVAA
jgi:hypothetical protein